MQKVIFIEFGDRLRRCRGGGDGPRCLAHGVYHLCKFRREIGRGRLVPFFLRGGGPADRIGLGENFVQLERLLLTLLSGFLHS